MTRSGANRFTGSVYTRYRNESYVGTEAASQTYNPGTFKTTTTGEWVGGPIIRNRLFFFQSFEKQNDSRPITPFTSNPGGPALRTSESVFDVIKRQDVLVQSAAATQGQYPKVFLASGKNPPAKAQDGKVIHVPYSELLDANGTPKAAKDFWAILTKAGLPRYAEIVVYADDPGEAAVNYFILKLMGYPDVKVLLL